MTTYWQYGPPIARGDLGHGNTQANPAPRAATPPIEWRKFCINGYPVSAQFQNQLHQATNQAVLYRARQLFWTPGISTSMGVVGGSRFRFAFRASTYHSHLLAYVTLQPPEVVASNSFARITIYSDATETTAVKTTDFYYGPNGVGNPGDYQDTFAIGKTLVYSITGLTPGTDYYVKVTEQSDARIHCVTVVEQQSMTSASTTAGYLPQTLNHDSEVLAVYRQNVATIQKNLWKYSGGTLLSWSVNDQASPATSTTGTPTNIIDGTSTTISANTPGFHFDTRYHIRRSQTTVPCVIKVYGQLTGAATLGHVYLKNSAGTTVTTVSSFTTTAGWNSTTFDMPAALDKYDLQFDMSGGGGAKSLEVNAVAIYPYET